ncbi:hypothetical protein [Streptomyces geranii]|nr:hypothetical protein [Streptomyces geranii]
MAQLPAGAGIHALGADDLPASRGAARASARRFLELSARGPDLAP